MFALATAIDIQPGALLATAPADTTLEQFNTALAPFGLCLPIFPLLPGLSLATLVARNAGGRRQLAYGPIGRYVRAAVLSQPPEYGPDLLVLGGPTIKRATGYGLNRAIAGGALDLGTAHELTFGLRPLPAARTAIAIACTDLATACRIGAQLVQDALACSAMAVAETESGAVLLVELEGTPAMLDRQAAAVDQVARTWGAPVTHPGATAWALWEQLANQPPEVATLDITLPRAALPAFVDRARAVAKRYRLAPIIWGDAGVGALHVCLATPPGADRLASVGAEAAQCCVVLRELARAAGGDRVEPKHDSVMRRPSAMAGSQLDAMRAIVGSSYLLTRPEDIACYNLDASIAQPSGAPLAVALPANTAEVAALVRLAAENALPIVTRGAGSGLAGGSTPSPGALILSLNRLEQITIDREQMTAQVGAGVVTADLQRAAELVGLFYPPDPSSQAASTIGGNIACNAGGPRCLKYGVTADYLLDVTAVLADGSLVRWGDGLAGQGPTNGLAQLLAGSEGTLAVICAATLRLIPQPAARRTSLALFATLDAACSTVEQIMAAGIIPAGLELMDDTTIAAVEAYLQIGLPRDAGAMLLMLADGEPESVEREAAALATLAHNGGAMRVQVAQNSADEAQLWAARRAVAPALARIRPNRLGEDISVPVNQIAACVRAIKQVSVAYRLPIVVFGHAGDGNLHPNILFDANDPSEAARLWPCAEGVFRAALAVGGTLSGEHGIGTLKRPFMRQAIGAPALAAQRRIKAWLDPAGRLNPGKVLPDEP